MIVLGVEFVITIKKSFKKILWKFEIHKKINFEILILSVGTKCKREQELEVAKIHYKGSFFDSWHTPPIFSKIKDTLTMTRSAPCKMKKPMDHHKKMDENSLLFIRYQVFVIIQMNMNLFMLIFFSIIKS